MGRRRALRLQASAVAPGNTGVARREEGRGGADASEEAIQPWRRPCAGRCVARPCACGAHLQGLAQRGDVGGRAAIEPLLHREGVSDALCQNERATLGRAGGRCRRESRECILKRN
eukprot:892565-Pleurochrysis_carterae.AAC.1